MLAFAIAHAHSGGLPEQPRPCTSLPERPLLRNAVMGPANPGGAAVHRIVERCSYLSADEPMLSKRRRSKMKKVMLVTLVLAVCGVFHSSVLAQETERYLVPFVKSSPQSSQLTGVRSATMVTVVNQSSVSCDVQVQWFSSTQSTALCTNMETIFPGTSKQFCIRGISTLIGSCNNNCVSQLGNNQGIQGTAIVSSSSRFECSLIAVEARVYYTTGVGVTEAVSAISNSKVVFAGEGNLGD
jgi:hypothetical protein